MESKPNKTKSSDDIKKTTKGRKVRKNEADNHETDANLALYHDKVNQKFVRAVDGMISLIKICQRILLNNECSKKVKEIALRRIKNYLHDNLDISNAEVGIQGKAMKDYATFDAMNILQKIKDPNSFIESFDYNKKRLLKELIQKYGEVYLLEDGKDNDEIVIKWQKSMNQKKKKEELKPKNVNSEKRKEVNSKKGNEKKRSDSIISKKITDFDIQKERKRFENEERKKAEIAILMRRRKQKAILKRRMLKLNKKLKERSKDRKDEQKQKANESKVEEHEGVENKEDEHEGVEVVEDEEDEQEGVENIIDEDEQETMNEHRENVKRIKESKGKKDTGSGAKESKGKEVKSNEEGKEDEEDEEDEQEGVENIIEEDEQETMNEYRKNVKRIKESKGKKDSGSGAKESKGKEVKSNKEGKEDTENDKEDEDTENDKEDEDTENDEEDEDTENDKEDESIDIEDETEGTEEDESEDEGKEIKKKSGSKESKDKEAKSNKEDKEDTENTEEDESEDEEKESKDKEVKSNKEDKEDTDEDIENILYRSMRKGASHFVQSLKLLYKKLGIDIQTFGEYICNLFNIPAFEIEVRDLSFTFHTNKELENQLKSDEKVEGFNYCSIYSCLLLAIASEFTHKKFSKATIEFGVKEECPNETIAFIGYPCSQLDFISKFMSFEDTMGEFWESYNSEKAVLTFTTFVPSEIKIVSVEMLDVDENDESTDSYNYDELTDVGDTFDGSSTDNEVARVNTKTTGNFFPYLLKKEFKELSNQLKRYQIYEKVNQIDKENCFVYACMMSKIFVKSEIEKIKTIVQGTDVTLTTIKELTKVIQFTCKLINVNNFTGKENVYYVSRGVRHNSTKTIDKTLRMLIIVLDKRSAICYHYYLFENTPFSAYFIKNFLNVKEFAKQKEKEIEYYYNADGWDGDQCIIRTRSSVRKITSKELINYLFDENAFNEIPEADLCKCNFYFAQNKSISDDLTNLPFDSREIKLKGEESEESKKHSIVYADFECTVQGIHKPFCICFCKENDNDIKFCYGNGCEIQFLKEVKKVNNPIVYFHNLSYDGRMLAKYGIIKAVLKCNKIYAMTILFDGKKIKFRDSLALIPDKLANFCQLFNLGDDGEKEIFPYKYYTEQTMFEGVVSEVGPEENPPWNDDQKNQFIENLNKLHLIHDGKFNAKEYCLYYCKRDVDILKRGFNAFRKMTEKNLKIDVCSTLTISSLAYKCFLKNAFSNDNIYEFTGATRNYIRKAVIGGRCMTCKNKKWKTGITHLDDFDACSLYPSAMRRLYIPQGIPYEWNPSIDLFGRLMKEDQVVATKYNDISNFIVTIEITKIGKELKFPLIMTKKDGINMFVNELCEMTIDNIYLEDLIKYQQIEFKIKKGVYWVGNKSKKMSEYIKYIYDIRADMKKKKDSNQLIYKLIMNSAYGKTIQKPIDTDVVFKKGKEEFKKYLVKNYNKVLVFEEIGNEIYMIKLMKDIDDFYVPCHIGVLILSMSKRIMNEVICTAEDLNLQIYYQDTDSIHIEHNDLQHLIIEYKNRFGRELVGTNMGQFHSDFPPVNGKESYSKESIFLGKKAYIDHLFNDNEEDDYCIHMKGVPSNALFAESNENYEGNLMKMYNEMFNGKEITFDLLKGNAGIELKSNFTAETRKKFERKIKF